MPAQDVLEWGPCPCGATVADVHHATTGERLTVRKAHEGDHTAAYGSLVAIPPGYVIAAAPGDPWPRLVAHTCEHVNATRTVVVGAHTRRVPHSRPAARTSDPQTSRDAAASAAPAAHGIRGRVLRLIATARKPLTDEEIVQRYAQVYPDLPATPAGIRSRRSELERAKLVAVADQNGRTSTGRKCRRYSVTRDGVLNDSANAPADTTTRAGHGAAPRPTADGEKPCSPRATAAPTAEPRKTSPQDTSRAPSATPS